MTRPMTSAFKDFAKGIAADWRGRAPWYLDDWTQGINSGFRILAPSTYIFFASAIPALAFGEQIEHATDGALNGVNILAATAICGLLQAVFGGQPLLIVGVAQPVVIVYIFMYDFLEDQDKVDLYLPWGAWTCIWAGLFIAILALTNVCSFIDKFTRFSGELFGALIGVLFMQQAVTGLVDEFKVDKNVDRSQIDPEDDFDSSSYHWRLVNGLWSLILAVGLLFSSLLLNGARSWRFGKGWIRTVLADYGVPLMIALWTGISYSLKGAPDNIPRRLNIPNTWDQGRTWKSAKDLGEVDGWLIVASVVPGAIIAVLYYFDHNISSKLAQQKEYHLKKPPAYHYDFLLLALMTVVCGLLGLPPANGAIPQSPMHTKSLASLKKQLKKRDIKRDNKMKHSKSTPNLFSLQTSSESNAERDEAKQMHKVRSAWELNEIEEKQQKESKPPSAALSASDNVPLVEVKEQRLSNLIQSGLVTACLAVTPVLQKIPKSVLWGYFAYMSVVNLPGSEFWDRLLLLLTDSKRRFRLLEVPHPAYLETVPFDVIVKFTVLQMVLLGVVWGITFAGFYGIVFPIVIMLVVPARQYLMPRIFSLTHLRELDMAEYEEAPAVNHEEAIKNVELSEAEVMREELDKAIIGTNIKHHITRDEIMRRRRSVDMGDFSRRGNQEPQGSELLPM